MQTWKRFNQSAQWMYCTYIYLFAYKVIDRTPRHKKGMLCADYRADPCLHWTCLLYPSVLCRSVVVAICILKCVCYISRLLDRYTILCLIPLSSAHTLSLWLFPNILCTSPTEQNALSCHLCICCAHQSFCSCAQDGRFDHMTTDNLRK